MVGIYTPLCGSPKDGRIFRKNSLESQRRVPGVKRYQIDFEEWRKGGEHSANEN